LSGSFYAIPTAQLGNVARVDAVYGNDSTAYIGGLPFATINAAIAAIVGTGSLSAPQFQNTAIWVLPGTYLVGPTGTNAIVTDAFGATGYPLISLPARTALRGVSLQTCTVQCDNPVQDTILLQMGDNCRVEDLNLTLGSAGYAGSKHLVGVYYGSTTTVTSKLRTSVVSVTSSGTPNTASNDVYGVQFDGVGSLGANTFSFNCVKGSTINVYGNGAGKKRGMIVSGSNIATLRDTNIYVARPTNYLTGSTGSYVGVETNDTTSSHSGSIQLRSTTVGTVASAGSTGPTGFYYTSSDILQTTPSTITDPTYLASPGIQVGPGVDLVTKSAGEKGFSTYIYPTVLYYGCRGTITATTAGWLWSGTLFFDNKNPKYPDTTTPPAAYRAQQPLIVSGISIFCTVAPGAGNSVVITVCKNSDGTAAGGYPATPNGATSMQLTLSGTSTTASFYNGSVRFGSGDRINVYFQTNSSTVTDVGVQVDCF
jgi:hypothetical protein